MISTALIIIGQITAICNDLHNYADNNEKCNLQLSGATPSPVGR